MSRALYSLQEFGYQDDRVEWTSPFGVILCMSSFFLNSSFPFAYIWDWQNTMGWPPVIIYGCFHTSDRVHQLSLETARSTSLKYLPSGPLRVCWPLVYIMGNRPLLSLLSLLLIQMFFDDLLSRSSPNSSYFRELYWEWFFLSRS